jgi:hypothetical protein
MTSRAIPQPKTLPRQKVLCFSPYSEWNLHHAWEATVLNGAIARGAEVHYVLCDGLFPVCDLFQAATRPTDPLVCYACQAKVATLATNSRLPFEWLGRYITPDERRLSVDWVARLPKDGLLTAIYRDWPVGAWAKSSVNTHLRMSHLDFELPQVEAAYREFLQSTLLACFALSRLLDDSKPDVLFLFNGRMATTRVALELARQHGIRVVCHERGFVNEAISLTVNDHCISIGQFKEIWEKWGVVPLSLGQLEAISTCLYERRHGRNLNWTAFSPPPQTPSDVLRHLDVDPKRPLWVLFTSSDDEVVALADWTTPFDSQMDWIERSIAFAANHPEIQLVLRIHPNTAGKRASGNNIQQLEQLLGLIPLAPSNVRFVLPEDPVSSYTLMDLATVGLVYQSTVALEMSCLGKTVVSAAESYVYGLPFVQSVYDASRYESLLDTLLKVPIRQTSRDIKRYALRYAYGFYFRKSISFPLVGMKNYQTPELRYRSLEELRPGMDDGLDRAVRILLDNEPACSFPQEDENSLSEEQENEWFDRDEVLVSPEQKVCLLVLPAVATESEIADAMRAFVSLEPPALLIIFALHERVIAQIEEAYHKIAHEHERSSGAGPDVEVRLTTVEELENQLLPFDSQQSQFYLTSSVKGTSWEASLRGLGFSSIDLGHRERDSSALNSSPTAGFLNDLRGF